MKRFEPAMPSRAKKPEPPSKRRRPDVFEPLEDEDLIDEPEELPAEDAVEIHEAEPSIDIGASTHASIEHPDRNEDANFSSPKRGIFFVADGMGGVPAGDQAAAVAAYQLTREGLEQWTKNSSGGLDALAAKRANKVFLSELGETLDQDDVEESVHDMIMRMNSETETLKGYDVIQQAGAKLFKKELKADFDPNNPQHKRVMEQLLQTVGCTATFNKMWRGEDGEDRITIGQIGDSRVYRLRGGKLEKLTRDDSHVQALIEEGVISDDQNLNQEIDAQTIINISKKRKEFIPLVQRLKARGEETVTVGKIRNMVTQAIGLAGFAKKEYGLDFKPRVSTHELEDEDVLLTCSDGIHDNLTDAEIQEILEKHKDDPQTAAIALQDRATTRTMLEDSDRAKADDVTALVTKYSRKAAKPAVKKAA